MYSYFFTTFTHVVTLAGYSTYIIYIFDLDSTSYTFLFK